jgi:hypothetical protein
MDRYSAHHNNSTLSSSATASAAVVSRLKKVIGLQSIADDWLSACLRHIQCRTIGNEHDEILYQILHCDLRDVVRGCGCGDAYSSTSSTATTPVVIRKFHDAIQQSHQRSSKYKEVLASDFQLLCQIEEVVDMSQASERRLLGISTANTQHQNGGDGSARSYNYNQPPPGRCLKICLVHGYKVDNIEPVSNIIVAMETAPIRGLSSMHTAMAGTKVLLKGPIEIRNRVLLLHNGNCIVLGGCIPWFVERQKKEVMTAKNKAGVGIDPTVRALIGTNPTDTPTDEGAADEAHESSDDYRPTPSEVALSQHHQRRPSIFTTIASRTTASSSSSSLSSPAPHRTELSTWAQSATNDSSPNPRNSSNTGRHAESSRPPPHQPPPRRPSETSTYNCLSSNPSQLQRSEAYNPYSCILQTSSTFAAKSISPIRSGNPYTQQKSHEQTQQHSFHHNQERSSQPRVRSSNSLTDSQQNDDNVMKKTSSRQMDNENLPPPSRHSSSSVSPASSHTADTSLSNQATLSNSLTKANSESNIQNVTFDNLHQLLAQLLRNRGMYESYRRQGELGFRVRLVQRVSEGGLEFNVEKARKDKKKDSDKKKKKEGKTYQYRVITTFADGENPPSSSSTSKLLACKIDPVIVESHFPVSATEMRSLSRTDKAACDRLTTQGGESLKVVLCSCRIWIAKLLPSADELFAADNMSKNVNDRLRDIKMPVLFLQGA